MPRKALNNWLPFLDDMLAFWKELGDDFKVGDLKMADVQTLRGHLQTTLDKLNTLQAEVGLTIGERDDELDDMGKLGVQFRNAVIGKFGPDSPQAKRVPTLSGHHAATPPAPAKPPG